MKILIVADTHGYLDSVIQWYHLQEPADMLLHLGDYQRDGEVLAQEFQLPHYEVAGNNDFNPAQEYKLITVKGQDILMVHGHRHHVHDGVASLVAEAKAMGVQAVLFGHTHRPYCQQRSGLWVVNPGSPSLPRGGSEPSVAEMFIDEKRIKIVLKNIIKI